MLSIERSISVNYTVIHIRVNFSHQSPKSLMPTKQSSYPLLLERSWERGDLGQKTEHDKNSPYNDL